MPRRRHKQSSKKKREKVSGARPPDAQDASTAIRTAITFKSKVLITAAAAAGLVATGLLFRSRGDSVDSGGRLGFVGSVTCRECIAKEGGFGGASHHSLAMALAAER